MRSVGRKNDLCQAQARGGRIPLLTLEDLTQIVRDGCAPSPRLTVPRFNHSAVSSFFDQCTGGKLLVNYRRSERGESDRLHSGVHRQGSGFELTVSTGVLSCNALISRMSSEKSLVTILAAIRSQEKKRENGPLQEVLPVRSSHIRTMTLRASSCSPHKTELYLVPERRKSAGKMANCLGSQPGRTDPLSQRLRAIARCSGPVSLDNLPRIDQRRTRLASSGRMNAPLP